MSLNDTFGETSRRIADTVSIGVVVASVVQYLPAIACILSIIYTASQLAEKAWVQRVAAWISRKLRRIFNRPPAPVVESPGHE